MSPVIAFDIETCPLPREALGPRAVRRLALLVGRDRQRHERSGEPFDEAEATRRAQSLHGALGWVCCASFVRLGADGLPRKPRSFSTASPVGEHDLLQTLWETLARFPRAVRWVSFHGKTFDVEFLATRSAAHGLAPTRRDLLHRHPFVDRPHLDLAGLWRRSDMGLADACELLGVASPKTSGAVPLDGSGVAQAVAEGRLSDVVAYCERDAVATLQAYRALTPHLS